MSSDPYRVGTGELCSTGPIAGGLEPFQGFMLLERRVGNAVQNLGDEVLLQLLPVVVDGRLLVEEKCFGLLDFTLDPDLLGDSIDFLSTGTFFDFDLGCRVGSRRGRGRRGRS